MPFLQFPVSYWAVCEYLVLYLTAFIYWIQRKRHVCLPWAQSEIIIMKEDWFFPSSFLIMSACLYSAYTFLKFMVMWTLVLLADFILEFRLEYLWPCWLFFGSVYTTFHCHGLVRTPAVCDFIFCALALMMISQPVMRSRLHAVNKNMAFLLFSVNYSHFTFLLLLLFFFLSLFVCRLFVLFLFALPSLWTSFV